MTLTRLLERANETPDLERLAREAAAAPQHAFVSASLRPFVVAALLGSEGVNRPAGPRGGRRRPRRARPGRRSTRVPRGGGSLLSRPRCALRVPPGAAAAPG